jgi:hypothetical protein
MASLNIRQTLMSPLLAPPRASSGVRPELAAGMWGAGLAGFVRGCEFHAVGRERIMRFGAGAQTAGIMPCFRSWFT